MTDKVINLREASGSDYVQVTPIEALDMAKDEPSLDKVLIIMIDKNDKVIGQIQGGGLTNSDRLWYIEKAKADILGPA